MDTCITQGCTSKMHGRGLCRSHYMKCWRGQAAWPEYARVVATPAQRFWAKVEKTGTCWIWTGSKLRNGYGQFNRGLAHRFAYKLLVGEIRPGHEVDHLCMRRDCVNPTHLEAVTSSENTRRSYGPSVAVARVTAWSRSRTHCKHGHELTPANTYSPPGQPTWRVCRTCKSNRKRKAS